MTAEARRRSRTAAIASLALVLGLVLSIGIGARTASIPDGWAALLGHGSREAIDIVRDLRVPRTLLAIEVGIALGVAGAVMQSLTRNPLAEPGLLGVNAGASLAIVLAIGGLGISGTLGITWFALAGAAAASVLVYVLGTVGPGRGSPSRLVLAGTAISACIASLINALVLLDPQAFDVQRAWVVGTLSAATMPVAVTAAPFVLVGLAGALIIAPSLDALELGDDAGRALGVRAGPTRLAGLVVVTVLCGAATAAAGPIAFVGLVAPQAARLLGGVGARWAIGCSALLAPAVLLLSDVVARVAIEGELPVAVVVAVIGAPMFLLVARRWRGVLA